MTALVTYHHKKTLHLAGIGNLTLNIFLQSWASHPKACSWFNHEREHFCNTASTNTDQTHTILAENCMGLFSYIL